MTTSESNGYFKNIASTVDPWCRTIYFSDARWRHIAHEHSELDGKLDDVIRAVETAEIRSKGRYAGCEVLYGRNYKGDIGPARWLAVVVEFKGKVGQVITAYGCSRIPKKERWL